MAHHLLADRFDMSFINKYWINHTHSYKRIREIENKREATNNNSSNNKKKKMCE